MENNEIKKVLVFDKNTGKSAFFDRTHADSKHHRPHQLVPVTTPLMAKIQEKFGITEHTINATKFFLWLVQQNGINAEPDDFNRSADAGKPKAEVKTDATDENKQKVKTYCEKHNIKNKIDLMRIMVVQEFDNDTINQVCEVFDQIQNEKSQILPKFENVVSQVKSFF